MTDAPPASPVEERIEFVSIHEQHDVALRCRPIHATTLRAASTGVNCESEHLTVAAQRSHVARDEAFHGLALSVPALIELRQRTRKRAASPRCATIFAVDNHPRVRLTRVATTGVGDDVVD